MFININACSSEKMQLLVKLHKIGSTFVIDHSIWYQRCLKTCLLDTDAVFDILSQSRQQKTTYSLPNLPGNAHIKASGMKNTDMLFISADSTCCKRRCHGIADRFLYRCK